MAIALLKAADYAVPIAIRIVDMLLNLRQGADQLFILVITVFVMGVYDVIRLTANKPVVGIVAFAAVLVDVQRAAILLGLRCQGYCRQYQCIGRCKNHHGHHPADNLLPAFMKFFSPHGYCNFVHGLPLHFVSPEIFRFFEIFFAFS
jgi:hypothetical protein